MKKTFKTILLTLGSIIGILILVTFLIVIIKAIYMSLCQNSDLGFSTFFSNWLYIFQLLSYFVGLISFISVIISVFKYFNDKKHQTSHKRNVKLIRTIHVINAFEDNIIGDMERSEQYVKDNHNINEDKSMILKPMMHNLTFGDAKKLHLTFGDLKSGLQSIKMNNLSDDTRKRIYRYNRFNNVIDTINDLEQWSLYIDENLVYYNLVYRETHHDYVSFLNEFKDVLNEATSEDDKYQACNDVYRKMKGE